MSDVMKRFEEIQAHVNYMKKITPICEGVLYIGDALWLIDTVKQQQELLNNAARTINELTDLSVQYKEVIEQKDQRIEEMATWLSEDCMHWSIEGIVTFKEVEEDGEIYASTQDGLYEKTDDYYVVQSAGMLGDDYQGTIIYPIGENKAFKIFFEC
ncbi:hypothetical protein [Pontibacillus salipaludis]|uniref:Uncharacterized protein n=1 Tax=Pontibacillus salipaludis TaxID=1697394 RepID=A0ABQ1PWS8_9BACI|nr:hypothetical protein [Pontibacillus salipaludis]GGD05233.1 hypothetical protein GCM10011389_10930 [Pontibacillus salipaludis]